MRNLLSCCGRHDAAIAEAKLAVEIDPTQPRTHMHLVRAVYYARRFEDCVQTGHVGLDVCPDPYIAFYTAFALIELGPQQDALQLAESTRRRATPQAAEAAMWGYLAARSGQINEAFGVLLVLKDQRQTQYVPAIAIAWVELGLNQVESSIEWLQEASRDGEPYLATANVSPAYDPIRGLIGCREFSRLTVTCQE